MPMAETPTTRDKIFLAGIKLFGELGYRGATVRAICNEAGTANATAVNYYFGGKEKLYQAILEMIFMETRRRREALQQEQTDETPGPRERLRRYLTVLVDVVFSDGPLSEQINSIFMRELTAPSDTFKKYVEIYTRQDHEELKAIIRDIMGERVPDRLIRDACISVAGQIFYYYAFWPVFSLVNPEHPGISNYRKELVDHIMLFSLPGLNALTQAWDKGELA